jgi:hypothetical protein
LVLRAAHTSLSLCRNYEPTNRVSLAEFVSSRKPLVTQLVNPMVMAVTTMVVSMMMPVPVLIVFFPGASGARLQAEGRRTEQHDAPQQKRNQCFHCQYSFRRHLSRLAFRNDHASGK